MFSRSSSAVIFSVLLLCSCSDEFLTREPVGIAAGSQLQSREGVEMILTGVYSALSGTDMFGGSLCTDWVWGSVSSDDSYKGTSAGDSSPMNFIERYENSPNDTYIYSRWKE